MTRVLVTLIACVACRSPAPPGLDRRWDKVEIDRYLEEVRRFAADSGASAFFAGQEAWFTRVEDRFRALLAREDPVAWFNGFFGARAGASYRLVPGLLTGGHNYGPHIERPGGRLELYSIIGLEDVDGDGLPRPSRFTVEIIVHEMAHSYLNPLVDRHAAGLERSVSAVFALVAEEMQQQAYGHWRVMAYESLVRAVTILYARKRLGAGADERLAREDEAAAFYWTEELADRIADGGDFMPRAIRFFDQLAVRYRKGIPPRRFRGPINAVFGHQPALVGTGARASAALAAYVAEVKKSLYAEAELLSGDATELALRPQVIYGSPATSPLVAELLRNSGWTVDASGIAVGGQRFTGENLLLIACRPHPRDSNLPVLIYTAASDDLIVNANAVFHGPTDWVVARRGLTGFEVIGKGDFRRTRDGTWQLAKVRPEARR